jgi:hypothetical protein
MNPRIWTVLGTFGLVLFVFGVLAWSYAVAIQMIHPEWLTGTLTHHDFAPLNWRVDDTGIVGFVAAGLGFFMWALDHTHASVSRH